MGTLKKIISRAGDWSMLIALSALLSMVFKAVHLPAAAMLGPMTAGVVMAVSGRELILPNRLFVLGQGFLGCLVAQILPVSILADLGSAWPYFVGGTLWAMLAAALLGAVLMRLKIFSGSTPIWGLSPGGAGIMTIMSGQYGADMRLVAFMQYLRVICVTLSAIAFSRFLAIGAIPLTMAAPDFSPLNWPDFGKTILVSILGVGLAGWLRFPSGAILIPLVLGAVLQRASLMTIELPPAFMLLVYAVMGWAIGLRFTRPLLNYVLKAFFKVLAASMALIGACALFASFLVFWAGMDPLTAYLATSPGGLEAVTIIAASTPVDLPFIIAMQTVRIFMVILIGPALARLTVKLAAG